VATTEERFAIAAAPGIIAAVERAPRSGVLVVEPHLDDAALSAASRIAQLRGVEVQILTVFGRSSYVAPGRPAISRGDVTSLRRREAAASAALLGARHRALENDDALLRFQAEQPGPDLERRWLGWQSFGPEPTAVASLARQLGEVIEQLSPAEVWGPMGLGEHVDHAATRDALLHVHRRSAPGLWALHLYEDQPYASWNPTRAGRLRERLAGYGFIATRDTLRPTAAERAIKRRALQCFASQLNERDARAASGQDEVLWRLSTKDALQELPDDLVDLAPDRERLEPLLRACVAGRPSVALLLVGCPSSPALLAEDARALRGAVRLDVFATPSAAADAAALAPYAEGADVISDRSGLARCVRRCAVSDYIVLCGPPVWTPGPLRTLTSALRAVLSRGTIFLPGPGTFFRVLRRMGFERAARVRTRQGPP
jgi:LmbE family N-acetylglucosaminyl deacetylase